MNFRSINVVISREYTTRVKKKSFLVTTFLVPVLFAALCCVPALIMMFNKDEMKMIAVIDKSGIVMPLLESNDEVQWADCSEKIRIIKKQAKNFPPQGRLIRAAICRNSVYHPYRRRQQCRCDDLLREAYGHDSHKHTGVEGQDGR